jgi:hypothetical protein
MAGGSASGTVGWLLAFSESRTGLRECQPTLDPSKQGPRTRAGQEARLRIESADLPARVWPHHTGTVHHTEEVDEPERPE